MDKQNVYPVGTGLQVVVTRLLHGKDLPLPRYMTDGAVGVDLLAAITEAIQLLPGERRLIPTGIAVAIPRGFEGQIRPRSGLALRHGVTLLNAPGTIDADYRGEIAVLLIHLGDLPFLIQRGERIAQLVFAPVAHVHWIEQEVLPCSDRGQGGFGHTGV